MNFLGGRKFLFAVLLVISGLILVALNKINGDQFLNFAMIVGATYVIGNVGSKAVTSLTPTNTQNG